MRRGRSVIGVVIIANEVNLYLYLCCVLMLLLLPRSLVLKTSTVFVPCTDSPDKKDRMKV